MGIINVSGIKLHAYHGCLEEESIIGSAYLVDVLIETDFEEAAQTDDLTKTVDYDVVYTIVKREMKIPSKLIEHVARRIADMLIKEMSRIDAVEVSVTKINPPVNGDVERVTAIYKKQKK